MFLAFYNKEHVGDTLLLVKKETTESIVHEKKGSITRVADAKTNETLAYNVFEVSQHMTLTQTGEVTLTQEQVETINGLLSQQGFDAITVDNTPKFVIGQVTTCEPHPDSDHLHVTQVSVGEETLQIVCGAPNVAQGQLVVVAKVGAVMPSGLIIWPGALRGVASNGMLCSARELGLPNAPQVKGILVLENGQVGQPFNFE